MTNVVSNQASSGSGSTNQLQDIRPPLEIPGSWDFLWYILAGLVTAALLYWAWRLWKSRKKPALVVPRIPPHVRARQKLQDALACIDRPREFCILVSDTIRFYLEERFDFHAPERTTEEFLRELGETPLLLPDQKLSLGHFLERCDLVKFAKYEPGEPELRDLHRAACRLVDETEPPPPRAPGSTIDPARSTQPGPSA